MRGTAAELFFALLGAAACSGSPSAPAPWQLMWSDEFDAAVLDTTKWSIQTGNSFGTGQADYDTARPENVALSGGNLVLTARSESYAGASFTSGRLDTSGKFSQKYGRFEARIRLPVGQGMWPAFWLLGDDFDQIGWPDCGEIDTMESRGADPTSIAGSLHGPGGYTYSQAFSLAGGATFSADYHVFAIEWEPGVVRWYVDDDLYETRSADLFPRTQAWVFDHPFFVILDLAVGGNYGGPPDATTPFPQSMMVDYVRVYARPGE
jgi:beta-glucanase (GH16 family)